MLGLSRTHLDRRQKGGIGFQPVQNLDFTNSACLRLDVPRLTRIWKMLGEPARHERVRASSPSPPRPQMPDPKSLPPLAAMSKSCAWHKSIRRPGACCPRAQTTPATVRRPPPLAFRLSRFRSRRVKAQRRRIPNFRARRAAVQRRRVSPSQFRYYTQFPDLSTPRFFLHNSSFPLAPPGRRHNNITLIVFVNIILQNFPIVPPFKS
jgi:hypothetical protein